VEPQFTDFSDQQNPRALGCLERNDNPDRAIEILDAQVINWR